MSKNKEPTNQEIPIDYQVEIKNLQYTIVLREQEIAAIKETLVKNGAYIKKLESDIFDAKKQIVYYYDIEKKVGKLRHSNELLKKDIENLNQEILNQKTQYLEEKKQAEKSFNVKINQLQNIIENSNKKLEMTNKITEENKQLKKLLEEIKKESSEIKRKSDKDLVDLAIKNKLKFSILKKKMMENIKNSQIKVTELNMQYMDVSSKLTLLQNHQLLTQLDYLQQQIDEYEYNCIDLVCSLVDDTEESITIYGEYTYDELNGEKKYTNSITYNIATKDYTNYLQVAQTSNVAQNIQDTDEIEYYLTIKNVSSEDINVMVKEAGFQDHPAPDSSLRVSGVDSYLDKRFQDL